MDKEFLVPFGLDPSGIRVRPSEAQDGVIYRCPSCGTQLHTRSGPNVRLHFYHHAVPSDCEFMYGESDAHYDAKEKVCRAINEHRDVTIRRHCKRCEELFMQPIGAYHATTELTLPNNRRADVALIDEGGEIIALIEIFETHEVDDEKAKALGPYPWVEISAGTVLAFDDWELRKDHWGERFCPACIEKRKYEKTLPFEASSLHVQCPEKGQPILAVERCSWCKYFVGMTAAGLVCSGGRR